MRIHSNRLQLKRIPKEQDRSLAMGCFVTLKILDLARFIPCYNMKKKTVKKEMKNYNLSETKMKDFICI